jgi:uncharacterized protein (DUF4415 family)
MPKPSPRSARPKTPSRGRADLARLRRMTEEEIQRTSPPELRNIPDDFWKNARVVIPVTKQAISIRLDHDVIEWFRASGPRYQSRINAVLKSYIAHSGSSAPKRRAKAS